MNRVKKLLKNVVPTIDSFKIIENTYKLHLFDVTLRDGLQGYKEIFTIDEKKEILDKIIDKTNAQSMELGSIVSYKVLPQMKDSIKLYNYATTINNNIDFYLLIPNEKTCTIAMNNKVKNMSFVTSVSDSFQQKNIHCSLDKTKESLFNINSLLQKYYTNNQHMKTKLYISCVNNCPIDGKMKIDDIVREILFYIHHFQFNIICLSDTCGNLDFESFTCIIEGLKEKNIDFSRIGLHLHDQENKKNLYKIINYAVLNNIVNLDISTIDNIGGCNVTLKNMNSNITYQSIYDSMV